MAGWDQCKRLSKEENDWWNYLKDWKVKQSIEEAMERGIANDPAVINVFAKGIRRHIDEKCATAACKRKVFEEGFPFDLNDFEDSRTYKQQLLDMVSYKSGLPKTMIKGNIKELEEILKSYEK